MTVSSSIAKHTYSGNGATTEWPYTFAITDASDIKVLITDTTGAITEITTGFTINTETNTATLDAILPVGWKITLLRELPLTQDLDLVNQGPFLAETIEDSFDKLTMIAQQLKEQVDRSVKVEISSDTDPADLIAELRQAAVTSTANAALASEMANQAGGHAITATGKAGEAAGSAATASEKADDAADSAADAAISASVALNAAASVGSDSIIVTPVVGVKTIVASAAAALFAGSARLTNRSKLTVRNDDPAIRIRVGPASVTQQNGMPIEPGGFAEFLITRTATVDIYAISEGAAVSVEVWES